MKNSLIFILVSFLGLNIASAKVSNGQNEIAIKQLDQHISSLKYDGSRKVDSEFVMGEKVARDGDSVLVIFDDENTKLEDVYVNDKLQVVLVYDGRYTKEFYPEEAYEDEQPGSYFFRCQGEIRLVSTIDGKSLSMTWGFDKKMQKKERCVELNYDPLN